MLKKYAYSMVKKKEEEGEKTKVIMLHPIIPFFVSNIFFFFLSPASTEPALEEVVLSEYHSDANQACRWNVS